MLQCIHNIVSLAMARKRQPNGFTMNGCSNAGLKQFRIISELNSALSRRWRRLHPQSNTHAKRAHECHMFSIYASEVRCVSNYFASNYYSSQSARLLTNTPLQSVFVSAPSAYLSLHRTWHVYINMLHIIYETYESYIII